MLPYTTVTPLLCTTLYKYKYKYKFCDDLSILELVAIGGALTEYDFKKHVASDIPIGDKFLKPENLKTQQNLIQVAQCSE